MARRTASGSRGGAAAGDGYALAALLVGLAVMGVLSAAALPVWRQAAQRERELELIFRGEQYVRAIELYQRVYAGAYPPDVDTLVEQRFLRRRYRDPMVADGEFRIVYQAEASEEFGAAPAAAERSAPSNTADAAAGHRAGTPSGAGTASGAGRAGMLFARGDRTPAAGLRGGVIGVVSRSEQDAIRIYNGRKKYSEWAFLHMSSSDPAGQASGSSFERAPRLGPALPPGVRRPR